MKIFDIGIVGTGVAGAFALHKVLKGNKNLKVAVFDSGRPGGKRRHQVFGFLGCLPGSDGKLYLNNLNHVSNIAGAKKTTLANEWVLNQLSALTTLKVIKDKKISLSAEKRINKHEFEVEFNNYYQIYPRDIHALSRVIVEGIENNNVECSFDNEVFKILKHKNYFSIITGDDEFQCKKILVSVGRGGWRWASNLFNNFGIIENNDMAKFGIRVEMPSIYLKDFNHSNCLLSKNFIEVGPFSYEGTVIPEDHIDLAITSFRSNENRWHSDKVSFDIVKNMYYPENAYQQVERIGKLSFILGNDRVSKEKISTFMNKRSKLSVLSEYDWLSEEIKTLNEIIPFLIDKGSFYFPTIVPMAPKIRVNKNFSTEVENMFVAGESANIPGILGAAVSGCIAAENMVK